MMEAVWAEYYELCEKYPWQEDEGWPEVDHEARYRSLRNTLLSAKYYPPIDLEIKQLVFSFIKEGVERVPKELLILFEYTKLYIESEEIVAFADFLFVSFEDEAKAGAAFPRYGDDCGFCWQEFKREIRKNVKWASDTYSFWQHRREKYEMRVPAEARHAVFYNGTAFPGGYGSYEIRFELPDATEEEAVQRFFPSGINAFALKIPPGALSMKVVSEYRDPEYSRHRRAFLVPSTAIGTTSTRSSAGSKKALQKLWRSNESLDRRIEGLLWRKL